MWLPLFAVGVLVAVAGVAGRLFSMSGTAADIEIYPAFEMTYEVTTPAPDDGPATRTTYRLTYHGAWSWEQEVVASEGGGPPVGSSDRYDGKTFATHQPGLSPDIVVDADSDAPTIPARWFYDWYRSNRFDLKAEEDGTTTYVFERRGCEEATQGFVKAGDPMCPDAPVDIDQVTIDTKTGIPLAYVEKTDGVVTVEMTAVEWSLLP